MVTYYLTITAQTDDPDVIADLISEGGILENVPQRLTTAGLLSSGCHFTTVDSDDPTPDTGSKVQALIEYLGEDAALEALEGFAYDTINDLGFVPEDGKAADREAGENVIRASNGDIIRRVPGGGEKVRLRPQDDPIEGRTMFPRPFTDNPQA